MMPVDSITKTFVAAEVLLLVSAGKVDLDAPISTYVSNSFTANGATVRQVMSMRSGVTDPPFNRYDELVRFLARTSVQPWTIARTLDYLKPTMSAPNGQPTYANANYLLLGLVVEKLTGRSMAQVLRADLFAPAQLTRIAAQDEEQPTPPMVGAPANLVPEPDGYLPLREWVHPVHDTSAGIAADAMTVATWGYALYGGRVLPAAASRELTAQPSVGSVFPGIGYALGTMVFDGISTGLAYGHVGSGPTSSSILVVVPSRRLALAVLSPDPDRPVELMARQFLTALA